MLPTDFQAAKPKRAAPSHMNLEQFTQGDPFDGAEPPAVMIVKEILSFL
jgi:hypothetical protein